MLGHLLFRSRISDSDITSETTKLICKRIIVSKNSVEERMEREMYLHDKIKIL